MRKLLLLCVCVAIGVAGWAAPRLVLYSPGFALVEEKYELDLEARGMMVLDGLSRQWMPDSLIAEGLTLLRTRPLAADERIRGARDPWAETTIPVGPVDLIGEVVEVVAGGRTVVGRLLVAGENLVLGTAEGLVVLPDYDRLMLPQPLGAAVELTYRADPGPSLVTFRYLTQGLRWSAGYVAVLGDDALQLTGRAQLANATGRSYMGADVELIAGDVGTPRVTDVVRSMEPLALAAAPALEADAVVAPAAEYQRYTLPGPVDLLEGTTYVPLVSGAIPFDRVYRFRGGPVQVFITFENTLVPLAAGEVRVFDEGGALFAGAGRIGHTPIGETVEMTIGSAFDLTGERTHVKRERPTDTLFRDTYRIVVRSAKDEDVTVEVLESMRGRWKIVDATKPYEVLSAQQVRFDLDIPGGGEVVVEFTVEWQY